MIIYSDDPRGVKAAIKEELEKDPAAQIQLKRRKIKQIIQTEEKKEPAKPRVFTKKGSK